MNEEVPLHDEGYEGKVLKLHPCAGMEGKIHYTDLTGPQIPPEGTLVRVIGPGSDEQHVRVFGTGSGIEFDLPHWQVDCGHCIFKGGRWVRM